MDVVDPVFSLLPLLMALATVFFISKLSKGEVVSHSRFQSIDGLRGYLALFVFMHHAVVWYFYLRVGTWQVPPSNLYTNFGQIGVALFFMITGFLFSFKIFDAKKQGKSIDWLRLFVSRVLRLFPLYLFAMTVLFLIIFWLSRFQLNVPLFDFFRSSMKWLGFTLFGSPDLNGFDQTRMIVAGVTWSLAYEWFFYLTLPFVAFLLRLKVSKQLIFWSFLSIVFFRFYAFKPLSIHLYYFCAGGISAYLVGNKHLIRLTTKKYSDVLLSVLLLLSFFLFKSSYNIISLLILLCFFLLITNGSTLFGLLTARVSFILGEMAYSLYLLHGIVLFICFKIILGFNNASQLSTIEHWGVISLCSIVLIVFSFLTYSLIEKPAMKKVSYFSDLVRKNLKSNGKVQSKPSDL